MKASRATKSFLQVMMATLVLLLLLESTARVVEFIRPPYGGPHARTVDALRDAGKQAGSFRIFVHGGSTVAGVPVESYGFATQLEFWLREIHPGKALEIHNFGVPGQSSTSVRRSVKETLALDPDLLIVLTGHNEFLSEEVESVVDRIVSGFALTRVALRLYDKAQTTLLPPAEKRVTAGRRGVDRDSSLFREKIRVYRENLETIVQTAREKHVPLLLMTAPANLADWPPVYRGLVTDEHGTGQAPWLDTVDRHLAAGVTGRDIADIRELVRTYGEHPVFTFLLARAHAAIGDYPRARALYTTAKDLDPVPWRVLSIFNEHIRASAAPDRVYLVDVARRFEAHASNGLVGFGLVADNCHPTPLGNALIAAELLTVMAREGLFIERDFAPRPMDTALEYFLSHTTTPDERRGLEMRYLLENAKYTMKVPFYNYRASQAYLDRALAADATDWKIWANLATLSLLGDRTGEGREQLRTATRLRAMPLDPDDRGSTPYLREALEYAGIRLEEFH